MPASAEPNAAAMERTACRSVPVRVGEHALPGTLECPANARGIVVFAHGSGSSRHSPRNRYVADLLRRCGLGTLLFDLLTEAQAADRRNVFDIDLLATRLSQAIDALRALAASQALPIALFGASTGAAAALQVAAQRPADVRAVVSRGGRPDLAGPWLARVHAPTLLIVGGRDPEVLELNRAACAALAGVKRLVIVPGATHLFEEPGALESVARMASDWFTTHLDASPTH